MTAYRGKRAFLTGAASGIGRALAKRLALEGASLIMADRDQKGLEKTLSDIQALKGEGEIYLLDAADRDAVHDLAQRLCQREGGVDLVISCAGILNAALVEELSYEDLERVMEVNFWGHGLWHESLSPSSFGERGGAYRQYLQHVWLGRDSVSVCL